MQKTHIETLVEETYGEAFPGRAFDIALIIPLVTAIVGIIKSCQESRQGAAKEAIQRRTLSARIALRKAIRDEHSDLPPHERRELFRASIERMEKLTDSEVDTIIQEAEETIIVD